MLSLLEGKNQKIIESLSNNIPLKTLDQCLYTIFK